MSYTLTKMELSILKGRLTRSINLVRRCVQSLQGAEHDGRLRQKLSCAVVRLESEVRDAESTFESKGWPDSWTDWERAYNDAIFIKQTLRYLQYEGT